MFRAGAANGKLAVLAGDGGDGRQLLERAKDVVEGAGISRTVEGATDVHALARGGIAELAGLAGLAGDDHG